MWLLWRDPYQFEFLSALNQMLTGWFTLVNTRKLVMFVYAKCNQLERRELWAALEGVCMEEHPWLLIGDFNIIRVDDERIGGLPQSLHAMEDFNGCIDACGLVEVSSHGQRMSWCNGHERRSRSWARLNRALSNMGFANWFGDDSVEYLKRKTSDHSLKLAAKLKKLKISLRSWNKLVFGRVDVNIHDLEARIESLEQQLQFGSSQELETKILLMKMELKGWEKWER